MVCTNPSPPCFLWQVSRSGPPVLFTGYPTHPLQLHPWLGPQTAPFLPQLRGNNAQCGGGGENRHPGVPAPVPRPQMELHDYQ